MEEKATNVLSKIFMDLIFKETGTKVSIDRKIDLEDCLKDYIQTMMGYSVRREYERYICDPENGFKYFRETTRYFQNLINNLRIDSDIKDIEHYIKNYSETFRSNIEKYEYSSLLFDEFPSVFSNDLNRVLISNNGKSYRIDFIAKDDDDMPSLYINDIENLDKILKRFTDTVLNSNSKFKDGVFAFIDEKEGIKNLLHWTMLNMSEFDTCDLEYYFSKYTTFFEDRTFDEYKEGPKKIGEIFNDELYLYFRKAELAYETPFYMSFMLRYNQIELPNVRIGIEHDGNRKVANILALQTSQAPIRNQENYDNIKEKIKRETPKSKNFRMFNPSHLFSLILTTGLLNGSGINDISFPEFMPLRYQRFVIEGKKAEEELHAYQQHLTDKFMYTVFRMLEFTDDIQVANYPENGQPLELHLSEQIKFNNSFLDNIYQIGYKEGIKLHDNQSIPLENHKSKSLQYHKKS